MLAFLLLMSVALGFRFWVLQVLSAQAWNCRLCVVPEILKADLPFFATLAAFHALSAIFMQSAWQLFWRILVLAGIFIYLIDAWVLSQFTTRLMVSDAIIYLAHMGTGLSQALTFVSLQSIVAITFILVLSIFYLLSPLKKRSPLFAMCVVMAVFVLVLTVHIALPTQSHVHEWASRNVIAVNLPSGIEIAYHEETREALLQSLHADPKTIECIAGRGRTGPIVLLLLESWSTYHSGLWSGLNDWTPRLDAIAQDSLHFQRMHAGGFNTNEGLISLFTGLDFVLPMKPAHRFEAFDGAWGLSGTLPEKLEKAGFHTVFLTSGDLSFTRKGEWLKGIGFSRVEGHEYPGYDGYPRLHFRAVPDDVLYRRALDVIASLRRADVPAFIVVENVSSHHPFIHPYTGERSEEAVFRFMDAAAADFIEALRAEDFFEDGLLVVFSDHRAMTPILGDELRLFGRAAASLIPAFVVGGTEVPHAPRAIDKPFHQSDLMPTLLRHVKQEFCFFAPFRDLLAPEQSGSRCVIHARGDRRDHLDVFCEEAEGTVRIAGDDSYFIDQVGLSQDQQRSLLRHIAAQRLFGAKEPMK